MTTNPASGPAKPRVAIVFGGRSSEHPVSCATAAGVMGAIDREVYDVVPVGITTDGRWVEFTDPIESLELRPGHIPEVSAEAATVISPLSTREQSLRVLRPGEPDRLLSEVDVVFPVLHGPYGEDGTLQGMLELTDTRYVGSGVLASAAGMDKHYMKLVLAGHGLPIGPYVVITDRQWQVDQEGALASVEALQFPVFVKPCRAGSSIGITKVDSPGGLVAAIEAAREHDLKVIVEQGIVGREVECGVLGGHGTDAPTPSEVAEIIVESGHEFYDFEAKYLADTEVTLSCPADLPAEVREEVRRLAVASFEAFGCEGIARVDCFYTERGDVVVNEINTMPGFTPHSMYPRMWAASGVSYPQLIDELIRLALDRKVGLR
ncbi:D-alanine--D-alanine ligase [Arsenicicoccus piscis]|uniref:D-alanine--D-alanine ligase family protein n=1 Tax=Arsenicicoccus piscis TaxID=673954 RepID=UPI001F4D1706|nr:D-alanine--D-alanine ligase family protein [Arsenicicoccus piscis]MCH8626903.1 D-alanine--D-alanine ligase [Arsenicicoccus piscis]